MATKLSRDHRQILDKFTSYQSMENPRDNIERIRLPAQPVRSEVSVLKSDETIGKVSYPLVNL